MAPLCISPGCWGLFCAHPGVTRSRDTLDVGPEGLLVSQGQEGPGTGTEGSWCCRHSSGEGDTLSEVSLDLVEMVFRGKNVPVVPGEKQAAGRENCRLLQKDQPVFRGFRCCFCLSFPCRNSSPQQRERHHKHKLQLL